MRPIRRAEARELSGPPYNTIAALLRGGELVLVLGVGASAYHAMDNAADAAIRPPTRQELAEFLAKEMNIPEDIPPESRGDLDFVVSYLEFYSPGFLAFREREDVQQVST